jgi:hypothetical protein
MRFHGIPWSSMRFYDVPVNRSVPTEANRGLTSYIFPQSLNRRFIFWSCNPRYVTTTLPIFCGYNPNNFISG